MMGSMFGHRWVSAYGAEVDPDNVWYACLYDLTQEQIRLGLKVCRDECMEWPPSAPEFRGFCLGAHESSDVDWEQKRIAKAEAEYKLALPDLNKVERGRERGAQELAGMKNMFRGVTA
jgi:hypothetical protein